MRVTGRPVAVVWNGANDGSEAIATQIPFRIRLRRNADEISMFRCPDSDDTVTGGCSSANT